MRLTFINFVSDSLKIIKGVVKNKKWKKKKQLRGWFLVYNGEKLENKGTSFVLFVKEYTYGTFKLLYFGSL